MNSFIIVLPDIHRGNRAYRPSILSLPQRAAHPSGNLWILGDWEKGELVLGGAGPVKIAVFGPTARRAVNVSQLDALASRVISEHDSALSRFFERLPGSNHMAVSAYGRVRFQGTATGLGVAFTACFDGETIASDQAHPLARLLRADPDYELLAARVASIKFDPGLVGKSWWRGVTRIAPGDYVVLQSEPEKMARAYKWWTVPVPDVPLKTAGRLVRDALTGAVDVRSPRHGRLSSDLSGGIDSTSLCFLAERTYPEILTFHWSGGSALNDDDLYATWAANLIKRGRHLNVPFAQAPVLFAPPYVSSDLEGPSRLCRGVRAHSFAIERLLAAGSGLHLAGNGADELFGGSTAYIHTLSRRRPFTAFNHARAHCLMRRWGIVQTFAGALSRQSLREWWSLYAERLDGSDVPGLSRLADAIGWGEISPAPLWATSDAVECAQDFFRSIAETVQPLAADRGQHVALEQVRNAALSGRDQIRYFATQGLRLELPYLDDRVVNAVLAIRTYERLSPWAFKPALSRALRDDVPSFILERNTKGYYEDEMVADLKNSIPYLLEYFEHSKLADLGIVDPVRMRRRLMYTFYDDYEKWLPELESALGVELWLRAIGA